MKTLLLITLLFAGSQEERLVLEFSDPARPGRLLTHLRLGKIEIRGTKSKEITISSEPIFEHMSDEKVNGMRRLNAATFGLQVEEEDNLAVINVASIRTPQHLVVEVPRLTSLSLKSGGGILVTGVVGELELDTTEGDIQLKNVGGSVVANSLNGEIVVSISQVTPGKAMSFTTLIGDLDVTLPPGIKCEVRIVTRQGEVYTDFEMELATRNKNTGGTRDKNGRYQAGFERALYGKVNGGGPRISFNTLQGNIYIRKGK